MRAVCARHTESVFPETLQFPAHCPAMLLPSLFNSVGLQQCVWKPTCWCPISSLPSRLELEVSGRNAIRGGSMQRAVITCLSVLALVAGVSASNIYIGNDTQGPVTIYTSGGVFVQNFGQGGATGSAINAAGNVWTVAPAG